MWSLPLPGKEGDLNYIFSAITDIGTKRPNNQDSYSVRRYRTPYGPALLVVLCDGLGGLNKGETASASLAAAVRNWGEQRLPALIRKKGVRATLESEWTELLLRMNQRFRDYGVASGIRLGTPVTAGLFFRETLFLVNVGDTRAYRITDRVELLTRDHTLVMREVLLGRISEAEAAHDPRRSVLLQCIGASEEIRPDFYEFPVSSDQVFLFCTDGFRHEISKKELCEALKPSVLRTEEEIGKQLTELTACCKARGEQDNITAAAVRSNA